MPKYRIKEKYIEGKKFFYPQVKKRPCFPWRTIKTEHAKLYCGDGRWQNMYSAKLCLDEYKQSLEYGDRYHEV